MAQGSLLHRLQITLADTSRGVYEDLDLRVARHPSETGRFLATRILAFCIAHEEGLAFSNGVSDVDEPAIKSMGEHGQVGTWIEVGLPEPDRVHRAAKAAERVLVFPHKAHDAWLADCAKARIHRREEIRIVTIDPVLIDALQERLERTIRWHVTLSDGQVLVVDGDATFEGLVHERTLAL